MTPDVNPNPNTSTNFNGVNNPVVFPATRFTPHKEKDAKGEETGKIIVDEDGNPESGVFEVKLFLATKDGSSREVAAVSREVDWDEYKMLRKKTTPMSVEQLRDYFPELRTDEERKVKEELAEQEKKAAESDAIKTKDGQIEELKAALAKALELAAPKTDEVEASREPLPEALPEPTPVEPEEVADVKTEDAPVKAVEKSENKKVEKSTSKDK